MEKTLTPESKKSSSAVRTQGRPKQIRFSVVDDEAEMRSLLRHTLQGAGNFSCVGSYANAEDALTEIPRLSPDLVLMDIRMPGMSGVECARRLKDLLPQLKIVMVTGLPDVELVRDSASLGADGYLLKPFTAAQCLATIEFALSGKTALVQESSPSTASAKWPQLTTRERKVMECFAEGLLYKETADKLGLSKSLVKKIQHQLFIKLGATNRTEAIKRWLEGPRQGT